MVVFLAESQLLPKVEQIVRLVVHLLAFVGVGQQQLAPVEGESLHLSVLEVDIDAPVLFFPA